MSYYKPRRKKKGFLELEHKDGMIRQKKFLSLTSLSLSTWHWTCGSREPQFVDLKFRI
jgi:hypothetical protein